jgi:hypothetical protein
MKVTRENIKYNMYYEKTEERFIIFENSYELQKYYVLEYDESRARTGVECNLMVTAYTICGINLLTAEVGRGQRGIEVDAKEMIALRNIVHFNCINPFKCECQGGQAKGGDFQMGQEVRGKSFNKLDRSQFSKMPYGDASLIIDKDVSIIGKYQRQQKDMFVMIQDKIGADMSDLESNDDVILDRKSLKKKKKMYQELGVPS